MTNVLTKDNGVHALFCIAVTVFGGLIVGWPLAWAAGARRDAEANARERERARLRAAQYEREAPWRARILAGIPAPQHITAAELRARVVLPTLRERLGRRP